ncbi:hypothetical protein Gotur_029695 [Gossypium turneri]
MTSTGGHENWKPLETSTRPITPTRRRWSAITMITSLGPCSSFLSPKVCWQNQKRVPMRLPTLLIVAGDVILTGKRTERIWSTVPLDLLMVLPVERVVSFTWPLTLLIMLLTASLEHCFMLSPKPNHFGSLSKGP